METLAPPLFTRQSVLPPPDPLTRHASKPRLFRRIVGWLRVAWILPGLATTSATLVLSTRTRVATAAGVIACAWLVIVVVIAEIVDNAIAPYRWTGQVVAIVVAASASALLVGRRRHLDRMELR